MDNNTKYPSLTKFNIHPVIKFDNKINSEITKAVEQKDLAYQDTITKITLDIIDDANKQTNSFVKNLCAKYGIMSYEEIIERVIFMQASRTISNEMFDMYIDNKYILTVEKTEVADFNPMDNTFKINRRLRVVKNN